MFSQNILKQPTDYQPLKNWMYFNRTRFRGTEGGWENHFPSGDPKTAEVVTLLSIYRAVRYCDSTQMELAQGKGNVTVAELGGF